MNQNETIVYEGASVKSFPVLTDGETVWLTQDQMCKLFGRERSVITKHIRNVFKEGELDEKVVSAKFAHTTPHGAMPGMTQTKEVRYYNLDVAISVGYRVKSIEGTRFRIWATQQLRAILMSKLHMASREACVCSGVRPHRVAFFLKKWDIQVMYLGSVVSDGTFEEHSLYPELAKRPVGDEARTALFYIHTEGTHAPIRYDEFGNRLWSDKDHYRGLCGETHYILKSVAAYLDDLKRLGVYDNSMIIVTADHGCCFDTPQLPKLKNIPTRAVPMLWIKPIGSHGDLQTTEVATSHAKIAGLVRRAQTENLTFEDCISELHTSIRRFRVDYDGFVDWYIDEEGRRISPPNN